MNEAVYSALFHTRRYQYRYNYTTQRLERLGKRIHMATVGQRQAPIVEQAVVDSVSVSPQRFDQCPAYWVELYDSIPEDGREAAR